MNNPVNWLKLQVTSRTWNWSLQSTEKGCGKTKKIFEEIMAEFFFPRFDANSKPTHPIIPRTRKMKKTTPTHIRMKFFKLVIKTKFLKNSHREDPLHKEEQRMSADFSLETTQAKAA